MHRPHPTSRSQLRFVLGIGIPIALVFAALAAWPRGETAPTPAAGSVLGPAGRGPVVLETRSEYSHIRLRRRGNALALIFVRDNGVEALQSLIHLDRPQDLQLPYTQGMFASYLLNSGQERVLMLGLGGGAMIRFLNHHHPGLKVDAVEIDPVVVRIADEHFGVRSGGDVRIVTDDAFRFVRETDLRYDAIYLDTFLKPSADTDPTGKPLKVKTLDFYKELQARLSPDGLVVFNINIHETLNADVQTIRQAFPQVYVFRISSGNVIAIGSMSPQRVADAALRARGAELDRQLKTNFSFRALAALLARP